jgi:hypothetical protein
VSDAPPAPAALQTAAAMQPSERQPR